MRRGVAGVSGLLVVWLATATADVVVLKDGSRVNGTVEGIKDGKMSVATSFAGTIAIAMDQVASFSTDGELNVALESGNVLLGGMSLEAGELTVRTADGPMTVRDPAFRAAWPKDAENPLIPEPKPPRQWNYELALNIAGKTGNTEKIGYGGSATATLATEKDRLKFYARSDYAREGGDKTVDELVGGVDYENNFTKRHSWYARVEMESDHVDDLSLRTTAAAGYGYYFIQEDRHVLRGRLGAMFRHESYENGDTSKTPGLDLGLHHMLMISDWGKLITDVTYTPSVEDAADYKAFHQTALDIPLGLSDVWKLRLGVSNEYSSTPAPDKERLDTTYFGQLVLQL